MRQREDSKILQNTEWQWNPNEGKKQSDNSFEKEIFKQVAGKTKIERILLFVSSRKKLQSCQKDIDKIMKWDHGDERWRLIWVPNDSVRPWRPKV